jgi:hypothetical protein
MANEKNEKTKNERCRELASKLNEALQVFWR